ncbi:hypothetical protein [Microbacterium sp. 2FI]|uniref:hypothetical protein n=1 Tax=Microbacterium sp. 2FI TaxID=2502193 RepID=UPI0010F9BE51|nr:hypothetical protein [Microbacterium sp. 2FI]
MREVSPPEGAEQGGGSSGGVRRLAGRRSTLVALAVAAVVVVSAVVASTLAVALEPRPDATLKPVDLEPDVVILALLAGEEQWAAIDPSTLRGYEPYGDLEVWAATNAFASPCLIAFDRATNDVVSTSCVPEPAELYIDVSGYSMPAGGKARFVSAGDALDVHLYLPEGED